MMNNFIKILKIAVKVVETLSNFVKKSHSKASYNFFKNLLEILWYLYVKKKSIFSTKIWKISPEWPESKIMKISHFYKVFLTLATILRSNFMKIWTIFTTLQTFLTTFLFLAIFSVVFMKIPTVITTFHTLSIFFTTFSIFQIFLTTFSQLL